MHSTIVEIPPELLKISILLYLKNEIYGLVSTSVIVTETGR